MIEKFTFDIQAYGLKKKMILVKGETERRNHVVMKLLAYILYYDPKLQIEVAVDMHYKPDLCIPGDHGVPELWIDCGQVAVKKVETLSGKLRNARLIILKETKREMESFQKVIEKKAAHFAMVEYLSFEKGFIQNVADALKRVNEVTVYDVIENVIGVALNEEVYETALYRVRSHES